MKLPTDAELNSLPNDGGDHFNRLVFENSLYLRQHALPGNTMVSLGTGSV